MGGLKDKILKDSSSIDAMMCVQKSRQKAPDQEILPEERINVHIRVVFARLRHLETRLLSAIFISMLHWLHEIIVLNPITALKSCTRNEPFLAVNVLVQYLLGCEERTSFFKSETNASIKQLRKMSQGLNIFQMCQFIYISVL